MAAEIRRLRTRPAVLRQDENELFRRALLPLRDVVDGGQPLRSEVRLLASKLLVAVDRETGCEKQRSFVMLYPDQNGLVVRHLLANSARPKVAVNVWALLFEYLRTDTGEVVLSRSEIAEKLDLDPRDVSRVMTELVKFGALSRHRVPIAGLPGPGAVRYFMNPNVGTHLQRKARETAQAGAPVLKVVGDRDRGRRRWNGPLQDLL